MDSILRKTKIKPNPKNPRTISATRDEKLGEYLALYGDLSGFVFNKDGTIISGHQRWRKLSTSNPKLIATESYPNGQEDGTIERGVVEMPDNKRYVYRIVDWPQEKADSATIIANGEFGKWDSDSLANEWSFEPQQLEEMGVPGFVFGELATESEWHAEDSNGVEVFEDEYEIPDNVFTIVKPGDLIEIGPHRILCGDSTSSEDMNKLFNGRKATVVFTDPPYGVSIGEKNKMLNRMQKGGRNLDDIKDDSLKPQELKKQLTLAFKSLRLHLAEDCSVFVCSPQGGELGTMMLEMMKDSDLSVRHILNWVKNSPTFSMGRLDYEYQHEPILFTWTKKHKRIGRGSFKTSIWSVDRPRASKEHPTMKPVALPANAILNHAEPEDIVTDIYLGSGTTMIAAHQAKTVCYGMEIMPKYCQVTINRMMQLDPLLKVKINGVEVINTGGPND